MTGADLVARLVAIRRECGVSFEQIAEAAGCNRNTPANWAAGRFPYALEVVAAWADRCGYELTVVPRTAPDAPQLLAQLVALLAQAHVTEPDVKAPLVSRETAPGG